MVLLATNAVLLAWLGLTTKARLAGAEHRRLDAETSRQWIDHEVLRRGTVGALIGCAMAARSLADMEAHFEEYRHVATAPFSRDLRIMQVCVSASPLLGLLGTVTGMLTTFGALAVGSGGEETMKMVAGGISEALITTETGLIIAIPGLLFLHHLQRESARFDGFLAHLETVCAQALHRQLAVRSADSHPVVPGPPHAPVPAGCGTHARPPPEETHA